MSLDLKSNFHQNNLKAVKPSDPVIYGFEDFRFDTAHLMLYRDGEETPLTPKQAETLLALIEQRGEIVSKGVLMNRLWGDVAVEESNLIQNIYILRKVLGNTRDGHAVIETFRRRGYRFNAELTDHKHRLPEVSAAIRRSEVASLELPLTTDEIPDDRRTSATTVISKHKITAALTMATLLAAVFFTWYFVVYAPVTVTGINRLAILPLKPLDPSNRNILYEIGIADSLINRLKDSKGMAVRPLSSVRKYAETEEEPLAAGHALNVDYVLASSYQLADGRIKVTSELLEVKTGEVEVTYSAAKDSASLFSAQDAIAEDIAKKLVARFGTDTIRIPVTRGTNNEEAYRLYLLAMNLSEERGIQNVLKCLEYLERAVELDPNYARAWAGIALIHGDIVAHTDSGQYEHYQRSMEAIKRALGIDPNLSAAYSALCYFKNRFEYDAVGAETACKHALELDPGSPLAHKTYANFLYTRGRFDEAILEIKTAIDIQPVSYRNQQIYGLTLYFARRFPEAEAQFKRLLDLNPNHNYINGQLVTILEVQGKESEAFEYLIKSLSFKKTDNKVIERFRTAYTRSGWRGVTMERIKASDAETIPSSFKAACLYAKLGDKDKAFEYLEKAFRERSFLIAVLQVEPQLDSLRNEPRYIDLVKRIEGQRNENRSNS